MQKVGVGIIGVGIYGQVHARTYKQDPRVELVRVWSRSEARARKAGEKFDCAWTTRVEDMLSDDRIQILSIATPDHAHADYAVAALKAGKHVLLEKPMAESTAECRAILAAETVPVENSW